MTGKEYIISELEKVEKGEATRIMKNKLVCGDCGFEFEKEGNDYNKEYELYTCPMCGQFVEDKEVQNANT